MPARALPLAPALAVLLVLLAGCRPDTPSDTARATVEPPVAGAGAGADTDTDTDADTDADGDTDADAEGNTDAGADTDADAAPSPDAIPLPEIAPDAAPIGTPPSGPPRFWSWQSPLGRAADDPRIVEILRVGTARTPEQAADQICGQLLRGRFRPGDVCILLQNFGMGDGAPGGKRVRAPALFEHWCDGLAHRRVPGSDLACERTGLDDVADRWWATPWMSHGIAECRAWMQRFVARYRHHEGRDARVPAPTRFHFDTEGGPAPQRAGTVDVFAAMMEDPRWDREPVPGHGGRALVALYEAAGRPAVDPALPFYAPVNRTWTIWYGGLCRQAMDGAMNEAAYQVVRATWPRALSSNYGRSARFDGRGDPPRLMQSNRRAWFAFAHDAFGDLQAPVCYWASPEFRTGDESIPAASVRRARETIDANVHSFGGPHWNVVPWLHALGQVTATRAGTFQMDAETMRAMLAMMRSRGIGEFLLWSDTSSQDPAYWNAFTDVVDRVFAFDPASLVATTGTAAGDHEHVRYARRDPLVLTAAPAAGGGHAATVEVVFVGPPPPPETTAVEIVVEVAADRAGVELHLRLLDAATGARIDAGRAALGPRTARHVRAAPAGDRVVRDGRVTVELRLEHAEPFTAAVDAVQAIPVGADRALPPPRPAVGNRDAHGEGDE